MFKNNKIIEDVFPNLLPNRVRLIAGWVNKWFYKQCLSIGIIKWFIFDLISFGLKREVFTTGIEGEDFVSSDARIIGGVTSIIELMPYQVSIRSFEKDESSGFGSGHICGGSIISDSTVLTAAQCIVDKDNNVLRGDYFQIVAGSTYRTRKDNAFISRGARVTKHELYNPHTYQHDIGIIKVKSSFGKCYLVFVMKARWILFYFNLIV